MSDGSSDAGCLAGMCTRSEKDRQARLTSDALEALADHLGYGNRCVWVLANHSGV